MLKHYELDICTISIYENYVINQIKEGIHMEAHQVEYLAKLINSHLNYRPFVYISNRSNSYSFDPLVYSSINKIENLKSFIIITNDKAKLDLIEFEKRFSNKKLLVYKNINEAVSWVNTYFSKLRSA